MFRPIPNGNHPGLCVGQPSHLQLSPQVHLCMQRYIIIDFHDSTDTYIPLNHMEQPGTTNPDAKAAACDDRVRNS